MHALFYTMLMFLKCCLSVEDALDAQESIEICLRFAYRMIDDSMKESRTRL